jgi:hypothetical protein
MGADSAVNLRNLEKPEDVHKLLRQDRGDDCTSCKVLGAPEALRTAFARLFQRILTYYFLGEGSGMFFGLGAYSYFSGVSQLEQNRAKILQSKSIFGMRSRHAGIAAISLGFIYMGLWRATK